MRKAELSTGPDNIEGAVVHWLGKRLYAAVRANDSETQTPLEFRPYGAEG